MPTVMIGTLTESDMTTLGPYSLVQPYYIAGKEKKNNADIIYECIITGVYKVCFLKRGFKKLQTKIPT